MIFLRIIILLSLSFIGFPQKIIFQNNKKWLVQGLLVFLQEPHAVFFHSENLTQPTKQSRLRRWTIRDGCALLVLRSRAPALHVFQDRRRMGKQILHRNAGTQNMKEQERLISRSWAEMMGRNAPPSHIHSVKLDCPSAVVKYSPFVKIMEEVIGWSCKGGKFD